jgi:large subunit ribosomal protein L25
MAKDIVLSVEPRDARGRTEVRKLRADGLLPGVIYGAGIEPVALAVPRSDLLRVLHQHGAHPLVTVKVNGGRDYLALVKDLQIDHVKQVALHVDFHRVQEDKPVQTEVEVTIVGTAAGVKLGGILEVQLRMVAIEALPRDLPEHIEFDVSDMEIGSTARISELKAPSGVTILTDPEQTLCSVVAPRVEEEVTLSVEEAEALAALSPEDLEALKEYAAAVEEAEPAEGEAVEGEGGEAPAEASEGGEEG